MFDPANLTVHPYKDHSLLIIISSVILGHLILLVWAIFMPSEIKHMTPPVQRKLIVQTVALNQKKAAPLTISKKTEIVKEEEKSVMQELEPIAMLAIPKIEPADIPAPRAKEPEPQTNTEIQEIKKIVEAPKKIEELPKQAPANILEQKKSKIKPEPKKTDIAKKNNKTEKTANIKTDLVKNKSAASKTDIKKKDPTIKSEKILAAQIPTPQAKSQKMEIDKAALERQKKMEMEQQAAKAKQQKLLSQVQENISKIEKSHSKINQTNISNNDFAPSPKAISGLQIDNFPNDNSRHQLSGKEASYRDELASRLKLLLKLPEYGEVKIKLTLDRSGKVATVIVLSAASTANRKYIEQKLQTLIFPAFGANFDQLTYYTFTITLCNDL